MSKRKWLFDNPKLMAQWDYAKNTEVLPQSLSESSGRAVWWKCNKGHSWKATINHRSQGTGCPYCSGRKVMSGYNDLKTLNPKLANEWNYEKNGELIPDNIRPGSSKKVWWKCKYNHEWQAVVASRSNGGHGCPYCAGQRAIQGKNDIVTVNPKAAREWDYDRNKKLLPENVCYSSNRKYWWKCDRGHRWQATAGSRMKSGCPYCAGKRVITGYNDLLTQMPHIAKQWDYEKNDITPDKVMPSSSKYAWWICEKGHHWKARVANRTALNRGCPYCSGHLVLPGFNDLATVNANLIKQWDYDKNFPLTPDQVTANSGKKIWWLCENNHSWLASIQNRNKGLGCPYCAGQRVIEGENDLLTKFPVLAMQWDYSKNDLKPNEVQAYSNNYAWWLCENGHSWKAIIANRSLLNRGCPYCCGHSVVTGENDLATLFPELAKEWDYKNNATLTPKTIAAKSKKKVSWVCSEGHSWKATVASRSINGNGCPFCSGRIPYTPRLIK